jgi:hypothetical protein
MEDFLMEKAGDLIEYDLSTAWDHVEHGYDQIAQGDSTLDYLEGGGEMLLGAGEAITAPIDPWIGVEDNFIQDHVLGRDTTATRADQASETMVGDADAGYTDGGYSGAGEEYGESEGWW